MTHRHAVLRARIALALASTLAISFAPGCELTTHFGDFQSGSDTGLGTDGGARDAGDGGARDGGPDANLPPMDGDVPDVGTNDAAHSDSGLPTHTVTVTLGGDGMGTLTSSDSAFTCSATSCSWTVPEGPLSITASADANSTLAHWDGACSTTAASETTCTVDVQADVALGATFDVRQVTLDVGVTGLGRVTSTSPASLTIDCTGGATGCSQTVAAGTSITLHATPNTDYVFRGWTLPSCTGTGDCTFTIVDDTHVEAQFTDGRTSVGVSVDGGDGSGIVVSDVGGIDCGSTCSALYVPGTHVTLTANAAVGSNFTSWANCPVAAVGNTCAFDVPSGTLPTITATFTLRRFTLTVRRAGGGTGAVSSASPTINCGTGAGCVATNVAYGTPISLAAMPGGDSLFGGWAGVAGCAATSPCSFTMTADTTATATFNLQTVHVSVAGTGAGSGTIATDDGMINCTITSGVESGTCSADYEIHSAITARVTAATGSSFASWSSMPGGYCTGTSSSCDFTAEEDLTVSKQFNLRSYDLDVTALGTVASSMTGMGSVTIAPGPTTPTCTSSSAPGTTCTNNYTYGTMVTLTAAPSGSSSVFTGWGGDCIGAGTSATCMVTMAAARSVTATFAPNVASLNVTTSGASQGTVMDDMGRISCGTTCNATVTSGTTVMLTATANTASGYVFQGWTGACASAGTATTCSVTISGVTNVGANFALSTRTVTVAIGGSSASGTVTESGGAISCPGTCSNSFPYGSALTLTATANPGYAFNGWSGCPMAAGPQCTISSLTTNQNITANFVLQNVTVTVALNGAGSGVVSGSGITCHNPGGFPGDTCAITVPSGTMVSLTASPNAGSTLGGWGGPCAGAGNACTFTATAATPTVTQVFNLQQFLLTVSRSPNGAAGTVVSTSPSSALNCGPTCSASFDYNSVVHLVATPASGYRFVGWSSVACGSNPTCDVTMTSAQNITATFVAVRTLQVTIPGSSTSAGYIRGSNVSSTSPTGLNCTNGNGSTSVTCMLDIDVGASVQLVGNNPLTRYFGATSWAFSGSGAGTFCGASGSSYRSECGFTMPAGSGSLSLTVTFGQLGNLVFLTENNYTPGTAPFTGVSAADTICRTEAAAAGLPGTSFLAVLSATVSQSFVNRLSAVTPAPAGWVRPDGRPVATTAASLTSGALIHPPMQAAGGGFQPNSLFWSNTNDTGTVFSSADCGGFAMSTGSTTLGHPGRTTRWATDPFGGNNPCNLPRRLLCVGTDGAYASLRGPSIPAGNPIVFTSSAVVAGDGSLPTMDAACAAEAQSASLPGTYVAFVSSRDPASSRTMRTGPLTRPDGWTIGPMAAWNGGTGQALGTFAATAAGAPLNVTADWTGMTVSGGASGVGNACDEWTDSAMTGTVGMPNSAVAGEWAVASTSTQCTRTFNIMCIQQ
ncbi:MAG: InlB B-repeat-containing protein [Sandaracinus sp.]